VHAPVRAVAAWAGRAQMYQASSWYNLLKRVQIAKRAQSSCKADAMPPPTPIGQRAHARQCAHGAMRLKADGPGPVRSKRERERAREKEKERKKDSLVAWVVRVTPLLLVVALEKPGRRRSASRALAGPLAQGV
jgi:hypothetical protein